MARTSYMMMIILLAHWNSSPLISDTVSWFRAHQSLLLLFIVACSVERQQMSIL